MQEEAAVFKQVQAGDRDAFKVLFDLHVEPLYLYAMGFVKRRDDAEDIVQEIFTTLWENRAAISCDGSLRAYLARAVRNACIDRELHERVKRRYREEIMATCRETRDDDDRESLYRRLHAALDTLPPRCREIFTLGCIDGLSYKEVAEATGTSVNTVKTQIKIAYKKLQSELGEENALLLLLLLSSLSTVE
ncbi:MAG: RNA polymerase sigma-70 factor [Odoribacteraceae bacterium]|jgi:RNA polymerase sigma-70 factor (ECF subfamily)|nr:RNA polymerase sigma-70 factor [Odoribacteraceae bacterium]